MRLRNIPGAKDAITESPYVVQNPAECKGKWAQVFTQEQPIHIEVGMGKGRSGYRSDFHRSGHSYEHQSG